MATITGNSVYADPTQWWTLDYTFANSKFTWSVTAHASHTSYWNSIYGLTVNIGGNSYYKGDIDWRNYTPNTVVYSGVTNLSDCTISGGQVTLSVSGNFYYGTWNTDYRSSGSGTCAVDPPTVATLTYTATNQYSSMVVAGRSVITFTMKGTSQTGSTSMSYSLYQDGSVISTTTGTSGSNKTVNVTAPSAGSHSYYYKATDGNGTTSTSGTVNITTYAYTPPAFSSISAVRWSTGNSSGVASDEGTYCKATANFSKGQVGTTQITTTCTVKVATYSGTASSGTAIWLGSGNLSADNTYTVTFTLSDGYGNNVVTTDTLTQGGRGIDLIYANGHYGIALGQKATADQVDINMKTHIRSGSLYVTNGGVFAGTDGDTTGERDVVVRSGAGSMILFSQASASGDRGLYIPAHGTGSARSIIGVNTNNSVTITGDMLDTTNIRWRSGSNIMTVSMNPNVTQDKVTRSSGWAISGQRCVQWGRFVNVLVWFAMASSGTAYTGNRLFTGTMSTFKPSAGVVGAGWLSANAGGSHSFAGLINNDGSITISAQDDITYAGGYAYISWSYIWI